jgi:DNA repair exonuclease SbcCD ATPase subunit
MNIMKLTDIKSTILIILFMCICFFIQTYYEIENFDATKSLPESNRKDIKSLSENLESTNNAIKIAQLKNDLEELKTSFNSKYTLLENKLNTNTTRLDTAQKEVTTLLTPTNSGAQ